MPHPERGFLSWQCGWNPPEWRNRIRAAADQGQPFPSPWLRMFQNAREWCERS
jgi:phosphoribosylformylglycinamidine synthase